MVTIKKKTKKIKLKKITKKVSKSKKSIIKKYRRVRKTTKRKFTPKIISKYGVALAPSTYKRGIDLKDLTLTKTDAIKESIHLAQRKQRISLKNKNQSDYYTYKKLEERLTKSLIHFLKGDNKYTKPPNWTKIISPEYQHYIKSYRHKRIEYHKSKKVKKKIIEKKPKSPQKWTLKIDKVIYDALKKPTKRDNTSKMARKTKKERKIKRVVKKRKGRATPTIDIERYKKIVAGMSASEKKRKRTLWKNRQKTGTSETKKRARKYLSILGGRTPTAIREKKKKRGRKGKKIRM